MFGIPNPLDTISDWFSDGAGDVWQKLVDKMVEKPELVIIPTAMIAAALVIVGAAPSYSVAYNATAGAKDAAQGKEFGHTYTGGIFDD